METLHNDRLSIEVSSLGAELQSIKDGDGKEYLWQGDDKYWGRLESWPPRICARHELPAP